MGMLCISTKKKQKYIYRYRDLISILKYAQNKTIVNSLKVTTYTITGQLDLNTINREIFAVKFFRQLLGQRKLKHAKNFIIAWPLGHVAKIESANISYTEKKSYAIYGTWHEYIDTLSRTCLGHGIHARASISPRIVSIQAFHTNWLSGIFSRRLLIIINSLYYIL